MANRNDFREVFLNEDDLYRTHRESRGLNSIRHYGKLAWTPLSPEDIASLTVVDVVWKSSDRLTKMAYKHYGETRFWCIIAFFNKKPTDSFCKPGDIIHIPFPLEEVLYLYTRDL